MPAARSAVAELLDALRLVFDELGVGWYLFGAQAALVYGAARLTADVDVTAQLEGHTTEALVSALRSRRFELRIDDAGFVQKTRVLPLVHVPTQMPADVVLGGPGLEELFSSRAVERDVAGVRVPVARAEDLVVMKVLAGREKDRADVEAVLIAQQGQLDLEMVRETLRLLEQALDQSDLIPAFDQVLARALGRP